MCLILSCMFVVKCVVQGDQLSGGMEISLTNGAQSRNNNSAWMCTVFDNIHLINANNYLITFPFRKILCNIVLLIKRYSKVVTDKIYTKWLFFVVKKFDREWVCELKEILIISELSQMNWCTEESWDSHHYCATEY